MLFDCSPRRTLLVVGLMLLKHLWVTWQTSTSGIGSWQWAKFIIWRRAAAKHKWAMSSLGWRPALKSMEAHPNGHSRLVANWTDLHGNYKANKELEFWVNLSSNLLLSFRKHRDKYRRKQLSGKFLLDVWINSCEHWSFFFWLCKEILLYFLDFEQKLEVVSTIRIFILKALYFWPLSFLIFCWANDALPDTLAYFTQMA